MSHGRADLHQGMHPATMQAPLQAELRDEALDRLKAMDEQGLLVPVPGWDRHEGTTLDAYIDILGLNDRALKDSKRH